eukprot:TRINITY_DN105550_c0_g1_i1.p1 TRINITY_DN105550_c0_g1~~TRINITY_DN105550_c0_g1_i1.p1  ORF type:complete len:644 (-),score=64.80 TRINITY_DN105550_c0_g1_i1:178-2109(-)
MPECTTDELAREVSRCVRQEVQKEFRIFLGELQIFGQEFGQSLQRFLDHVGQERTMWTEGGCSDASTHQAPPIIEADRDENHFETVGSDDVMTEHVNNAEGASQEKTVDAAESQVLAQVTPSPPSAMLEVPMPHVVNSLSSLQNASECDWSLRPSPSGNPSHRLPVYVKTRFDAFRVVYDGHEERMQATLEMMLTWSDPRLIGLHNLAKLPDNLWAPVPACGPLDGPPTSNAALPFCVNVFPQGVHASWWQNVVVHAPIFAERDRAMDAAGYGPGPWLTQKISGIPLDACCDDAADSLSTFPHDLQHLTFAFCCWSLDNIDDEQQMLDLKQDAAYHYFYGESSIHLGHSRGEWGINSLSVHEAYHTSIQTDRTYPDILIRIAIQRQSSFYFWKARVPVMSALLMECCVFLIRTSMLDGIIFRMSTSVAVLFSVVAIQMSLEGQLPKSRVLHKLDKIFLAAAVFLVIVVLQSAVLYVLARDGWMMLDRVDYIDAVASLCTVSLLVTYFVGLEISVRRALSRRMSSAFSSCTATIRESIHYEMSKKGRLQPRPRDSSPFSAIRRTRASSTSSCQNSKPIHSPLGSIERTSDADGGAGDCAQPISSPLELSKPSAARVCSRHGLQESWNVSNPCKECIQQVFEATL